MTRAPIFYWITVLSLLAGCKPAVAAPETQGASSPEAVALSLSMVDPEESLHLFDYERQAPPDIQETCHWHEGGATWNESIEFKPVISSYADYSNLRCPRCSSFAP